MKTMKLWQIFAVIVCVVFVAMIVYGINTDCPDTAGYVYCGGDSSWSLQKLSQQRVGHN